MEDNRKVKSKHKEYGSIPTDKRRNEKQFSKDKRIQSISSELTTESSSTSPLSNRLLALFTLSKSKNFDEKQEKEEQEEREIRRRARREASLEDFVTDEFAPTIFEPVNAPLKPVTNFECFRKRKASEQTSSLTQLSTPNVQASTPTASVYLYPDRMRLAEPVLEKPEYTAPDGFQFVTDQIMLASQKKSGRSDEAEIANIADKALAKKERKHRRFIHKLFTLKRRTRKEAADVITEETLPTTHESLEGLREQTEEKEKATGQSVYFMPDLKMEQNLTTANDMSYCDSSSSTTVTSKKGSAELESSKQPIKAIISEMTSATENATKQTLPSSSTIEPNTATSRFHRKIFTTLRRGVGVIGNGVASATRKGKESDVSSKKTPVMKGSELKPHYQKTLQKEKKIKISTQSSLLFPFDPSEHDLPGQNSIEELQRENMKIHF